MNRATSSHCWRLWHVLHGIWLLLIACVASPAWAESSDWQLWRDAQQVQVYERSTNERPYAEIRAETVLSTSLSAFVHLLRDTAQATRWIARVQSVTELARYSETENLVETRFNGFWPVRERWVRTASVFRQDSQLQLTLQVENQYQADLDAPGVQMAEVQALWQLTPLGNGQVRIRYQGYADPGDQLPAWLADSAALHAIFDTFVAMRRELQRPKYRQPVISFIREP